MAKNDQLKIFTSGEGRERLSRDIDDSELFDSISRLSGKSPVSDKEFDLALSKAIENTVKVVLGEDGVSQESKKKAVKKLFSKRKT